MLQRRLSYWLTLCLCRPILEYADAVWNPSARSKTHDVELVQTIAVRFISNLKGHTDSVSEAKNQLQLQSLEDRRAPTVLPDADSLKLRSAPHTIHSLWWDCKGQTAGDSRHSFSCQRRADLNMHQEKRLSCKFPATNYSWDAQKKQITIKQQNAIKIANPNLKIVKTRCFPTNTSCCRSSTSSEVICYLRSSNAVCVSRSNKVIHWLIKTDVFFFFSNPGTDKPILKIEKPIWRVYYSIGYTQHPKTYNSTGKKTRDKRLLLVLHAKGFLYC